MKDGRKETGLIGEVGNGVVLMIDACGEVGGVSLNACATSMTVARFPVLGILPWRTGLGDALRSRRVVSGGVTGGEGGANSRRG